MKNKTIKCLVIVIFCVAFFVSHLFAGPWDEFVVSASGNNQGSPDIDGTIVVWQEDFESDGWGWDVCGSDISDETGQSFFYVAADPADQVSPSIYGNIVVLSSFVETDFDIWASDISDLDAIDIFGVSQQVNIDEENPVIHGNTVLWQDNRYSQEQGFLDVDVFGADIHDKDSITDFLVSIYEPEDQVGYDQRKPAIWRNRVVCETNYFGDWDIMSSDIWLRDDPQETPVIYDFGQQLNPAVSGDVVVWQDDGYGDMDIYAADISNPDSPEFFDIAVLDGQQESPDIDGNIVVWQDNLSGTWGIYGYNIVTSVEFVICDEEFSNQTNPSINGNTVVWEDDRSGVLQIYAAILYGSEIAGCDVKPTGDLNGDCLVDLYDLAIVTANWMQNEQAY